MENKVLDSIASSEQFSAELAGDLKKVENLLLQELSVSNDFMSDQITYLAKAGGKRFRPLFTILTSKLVQEKTSPKIISAASMLEMIHLATLYHDDVMDEADLRRGVQAAQLRWNNSLAILAGDYLFAKSSILASSLGLEVVKQLSDTYALLVTGQFRETVGKKAEEDHISYYSQVIFEKTGSLIAACGYIAGILTDSSKEITSQLYKLGSNLGVAFQIADDLIDLQASSAESGKVPGTDLREGVLTMPVIYALQEDSSASQEIAKLLETKNFDEVTLEKIRGLIKETSGIAKTREVLQGYKTTCETILADLPNNDANKTLKNLVSYTIDRVN